MPIVISNSSAAPQKPQRKLPSRPIIGGCCATPVAAMLLLYIVYLAHNRVPQIVLPTHTVPADNALPFVDKCQAACKAMVHTAPSITGERTYSNYADSAADAEPMLKLLSEAIKHPYVNASIRSRKDDTFPKLAGLRDLFRTVGSVANYYELSGNSDRAMQIRLDGLELAVMITRGGTLIASSMSTAFESVARNRMELLIPHLSDAQLAATAARLELIQSKRTPFCDVIVEDSYETTARLIESFRKTGKFENPLEDTEVLGAAGPEPPAPLKERLQLRYETAKFDFKDKSEMLKSNIEWVRSLAAEMNTGYRSESAVPVPNNLFAELYTGLYKSGECQSVSSETIVDILRIEVALERYRRANAIYPASLESLLPRFLKTLPKDPFNPARRFTYGVNSDVTYTLYSFGTDCKDNGGTPGKYINMGEGDIVAGRLIPGGYPPLIPNDGSAGVPNR